MANKYAHIKQLIEFWQCYEDENNHVSYSNFAKWLIKKENIKHNKLNNQVNSENVENFYPEFSKKQQISILLSRINRLQEFYVKKFFDGLIINTMLEFIFLYSINKNPGLKKTEIINMHLIEYTTGIDIMKRLKGLDLITEYKDKLDKRSKNIKVTLEGKKTIMEALLRINQVNDFFYEILNDDKLEELLPAFKSINNYHQKIFQKYNGKPYFDLFQLIGSTREG